MIEDHANRQHVLGLMKRLDAILVAVLNPKFLELRQILRHGIIEREFAFLDQLGNRHTAETLGLRALHEDIVEFDGAFLLDVCIADAASFLHAVVIEDADCARQLASVHIRLQHFLSIRSLGIDNFFLRTSRKAARQSKKE